MFCTCGSISHIIAPPPPNTACCYPMLNSSFYTHVIQNISLSVRQTTGSVMWDPTDRQWNGWPGAEGTAEEAKGKGANTSHVLVRLTVQLLCRSYLHSSSSRRCGRTGSGGGKMSGNVKSGQRGEQVTGRPLLMDILGTFDSGTLELNGAPSVLME